MDWGSIAGSVISAGSGGVLGILGSVIGVGAKYLQKKQDMKFEEKKWGYETALLKLNMEAKSQETEDELALVSQEGSFTGLAESIKAEASISNVHSFVNDVRALFRLVLTTGLWVLACLIFYKIVGGVDYLTDVEINELVRYMVYSVFFCASTATMWWFGDRALTPPGMK